MGLVMVTRGEALHSSTRHSTSSSIRGCHRRPLGALLLVVAACHALSHCRRQAQTLGITQLDLSSTLGLHSQVRQCITEFEATDLV